jgi:hypothetical protein
MIIEFVIGTISFILAFGSIFFWIYFWKRDDRDLSGYDSICYIQLMFITLIIIIVFTFSFLTTFFTGIYIMMAYLLLDFPYIVILIIIVYLLYYLFKRIDKASI